MLTLENKLARSFIKFPNSDKMKGQKPQNCLYIVRRKVTKERKKKKKNPSTKKKKKKKVTKERKANKLTSLTNSL
jgi:hypothetical protein